MVFQQKGIKINITEKGKPRPVSELLKDLLEVKTRPVHVKRKEQTNAVHQQLYVVFEKPSLLKGVKINHRFVWMDLCIGMKEVLYQLELAGLSFITQKLMKSVTSCFIRLRKILYQEIFL